MISAQAGYDQTVHDMAAWLKADVAWIGILDNSDIEVRALIMDGEIQPGCRFDYTGSYCEEAVTADEAIASDGLHDSGRIPSPFASLPLDTSLSVRIMRSDGKTIGLLSVLARKPLDTPPHAVDLLKTVAARIAAELELAEAKRGLRHDGIYLDRVINGLHEALVVIDNHLVITDVNNHFLHSHGAAMRSDVVGRHCCDVLSVMDGGDGRDRARELLLEVLATGEPARGELRREVAPDGKTQHYAISVAPLLGENGDVELLVALLNDVTNIRQSEAQRQELPSCLATSEHTRSMGLLASGVAHDLNNVLGPLVVLSDVVASTVEDLAEENGQASDIVSELREDLDVMHQSAARAGEVVKDLLTLSRRASSVMRPIDMNLLISQVLTMPEVAATGVDVRLAKRLDDSIHTVMGSEGHLTRVLTNILRNGIEAATSCGGDVTISTEQLHVDDSSRQGHTAVQTGDYVVVRIQDTGPGISPEDIPRVFEPFFTRKRQSSESGSGLGLAIVHAVVKDHGGFIDLSSQERQGTLFSIYLPATTRAPEKKITFGDIPRGDGETILVVDDKPSQRNSAKRVLSRLGYRVATASSGEEAAAMAMAAAEADRTKPPFDLAVIDMTMGDGRHWIDTLKRLRTLNTKQRAVVVGGVTPNHQGGQLVEMGALWLSKPYSGKLLAETVRAALDKPVVVARQRAA